MGRREDDVASLTLDLLGRAARRARKEVSRAAEAGRHQLELREARQDLQSFWIRLGKTAYRLTDTGELDHPELQKAVARIQELESRIQALERGLPGDTAE